MFFFAPNKPTPTLLPFPPSHHNTLLVLPLRVRIKMMEKSDSRVPFFLTFKYIKSVHLHFMYLWRCLPLLDASSSSHHPNSKIVCQMKVYKTQVTKHIHNANELIYNKRRVVWSKCQDQKVLCFAHHVQNEFLSVGWFMYERCQPCIQRIIQWLPVVIWLPAQVSVSPFPFQICNSQLMGNYDEQ